MHYLRRNFWEIGPADAADATKDSFTIAIKGIFIRSLYEAYSRIANGSAQATFIRSFITTQACCTAHSSDTPLPLDQHVLTTGGRQLNALVDLASSPQGNQYSPQWEGPGPTKVLPWGQPAALDVLNAAVGFGDSFDVARR